MFYTRLSPRYAFGQQPFDRCLSSLFFHHLNIKNKEKTFREIYRILKPAGELHTADWGKPSNDLIRFLFYQIQLLDGFESASDNINGMLPELMRSAGFDNVNIVDKIPSIFGTMTLYSAAKLPS